MRMNSCLPCPAAWRLPEYGLPGDGALSPGPGTGPTAVRSCGGDAGAFGLASMSLRPHAGQTARHAMTAQSAVLGVMSILPTERRRRSEFGGSPAAGVR